MNYFAKRMYRLYIYLEHKKYSSPSSISFGTLYQHFRTQKCSCHQHFAQKRKNCHALTYPVPRLPCFVDMGPSLKISD